MINPADEFVFTWNGETAQWVVPPELKYLDGHFPGFPVVPAVALLDATIVAIRQLKKDSSLDVSKITSAKFLKPVHPHTTLELRLTEKEGSQSWGAKWAAKAKEDGSELVADFQLDVLRRGFLS